MPRVARSSPPTICSSVLLPHPLGPSRHEKRRDAKRCEKRSSATMSVPPRPGQTCVTSSTMTSTFFAEAFLRAMVRRAWTAGRWPFRLTPGRFTTSLLSAPCLRSNDVRVLPGALPLVVQHAARLLGRRPAWRLRADRESATRERRQGRSLASGMGAARRHPGEAHQGGLALHRIGGLLSFGAVSHDLGALHPAGGARAPRLV